MLVFDSLTHQFDDEPVLREVSFAAEPGKVTCVVGPSGCGKTTLLRLAAGLLDVQAGRITLDGERLADAAAGVPPEQRPVGLVFQEGALFPHLTVADNVGFGLRGRRARARIDELLELVGLTACAGRYPHTLSGGQRQRVALVRAMAPRPRALLFDEPYANLDQTLRRALRREARQSVRQTATIGVFVTHDPDDVMALADQVVVLEAGRVLEIGTPRALYDCPDTAAVARLFGNAEMLSAARVGDVVRTAFGDWPLSALREPVATPSAGRLELTLRADALTLERDDAGLPIADLRVAGRFDLVLIQAADATLLGVELPRPHRFRPGDRVRVRPQPASVLLSATQGEL